MLKEDTALGADIIGDILTHSTFEPEELERERGVILQEIGQANDTPDDIIFDHFQEAAYPVPAARPRRCWAREDGIRDMPRDGADRLHEAALRQPPTSWSPRPASCEHEQILDLVQQHFADLPAQLAAADR